MSLKLCHCKDQLSQAERTAERSKHSWHQRKYQVVVTLFLRHPLYLLAEQLFQRHCEVAKRYGPLQQHLGVLDVLGIDGMSSNESDMDPTTNQRRYTVVKPDW